MYDMNELPFIGQGTILGIGFSTTGNNFKSRRGYVR